MLPEVFADQRRAALAADHIVPVRDEKEGAHMAARFLALLIPSIATPCALGVTGASSSEPFQLGLPESDGPVAVEIGFRLRKVTEVNEQTETFEFGGVLMLKWRDDRQAFDAAALGVRE